MAIIDPNMGKEICTALGLDPFRVTDVSIHLSVGCQIHAQVKYLPDKEQIDKLVPIFARYELKEREIVLQNNGGS